MRVEKFLVFWETNLALLRLPAYKSLRDAESAILHLTAVVLSIAFPSDCMQRRRDDKG